MNVMNNEFLFELRWVIYDIPFTDFKIIFRIERKYTNPEIEIICFRFLASLRYNNLHHNDFSPQYGYEKNYLDDLKVRWFKKFQK